MDNSLDDGIISSIDPIHLIRMRSILHVVFIKPYWITRYPIEQDDDSYDIHTAKEMGDGYELIFSFIGRSSFYRPPLKRMPQISIQCKNRSLNFCCSV
jgi:hypothetical protein